MTTPDTSIASRELESAVAILDKHNYRGCRWSVVTAGTEYQLRFADGDFIATNVRAERITFVEFEACAIAAALEPMTPELLRDCSHQSPSN